MSKPVQRFNALSHGYFKVDLELVWRTIHSDLPQLHRVIGSFKKIDST
jgi:uncharacterized protein with HEPN domain